MELLEIAKANAAKALGTANFDLPASLRAKEASQGAVSCSGPKTEHSEKQTEVGTKNASEKSAAAQRNIAFSSNNSVAKPLEKTTKAAVEETSSGSPKIDKKKVLMDCGYLSKGKLRGCLKLHFTEGFVSSISSPA